MNSCPLCCSSAVQKLTLQHTVVWKCQANDCGLQFAFPQLDEQHLAHLYTTFYYPSTDNRSPVRYEGTPDTVLRQVFTQLQASLGALKGLRLLDYGCGGGPLSHLAFEFGLSPAGIEPDPVARVSTATRLGIPVFANLEELRSQDSAARFDLIVLWNVVEHLREPWSDLREMRALLRPGGRLLICTMNTGCLRACVERGRWMSYENPTHFYYFDRKSLERVLCSSGFHRTQEWKPKIRYPHHGVMRRCFYQVSGLFGVSDGLYYLCSADGQNAQLPSQSAGGLNHKDHSR